MSFSYSNYSYDISSASNKAKKVFSASEWLFIRNSMICNEYNNLKLECILKTLSQSSGDVIPSNVTIFLKYDGDGGNLLSKYHAYSYNYRLGESSNVNN